MLGLPTHEDLDQARALLQPERLFLVTEGFDNLGEEVKQELSTRLEHVVFPREWASRLQSILLMLHDGRERDPAEFIRRVYLPWLKFRNELLPSRQRVGREMARIGTTAEGSVEETEHFIALYRTVVSDVLDPYLTLLVACHQFIAGTFADLEAANYGLGEFNKAEFLRSGMKRRGDTADLLCGYNHKVRNAISHAGSHGVTIEGRSVLFRDIKRGTQPAISTVRWSVDELGQNGVLMAELVNCIDTATEIFGLDCVQPNEFGFETLLQMIDSAFTREQRSEIVAQLHDGIEKVWRNPELTDSRRRAILATILEENCRKREIALRCVDLSEGNTTVLIAVPLEGTLDEVQSFIARLVELTRYLILARAIFGPFGERIVVAETDQEIKRFRLQASVPSALLDDYACKKARLVDLLRAGKFAFEMQRLDVEINEQALAEMDDQSLGPSFPRRGPHSPK